MKNDLHSAGLVETAIGVSIAGIAVGDYLLGQGIAVWALYFIPLALCIQQRLTWLPYALAALCAALIVADFLATTYTSGREAAALSRGFGIVALFSVAVLVHRIILSRVANEQLAWHNEGHARVAATLIGEQRVDSIARNLLDSLANYVGADVGVVYVAAGEELVRAAGFAVQPERLPERIRIGQGVIGQVATDGVPRAPVNDASDAMRVSSALGEALPRHVVAVAVRAEKTTMGAMEIGFLGARTDIDAVTKLSAGVGELGGVALRSARYRERQAELLAETQRQTEVLQVQQEELRVINEELEEQGRALRESQALLEQQQAEVEQANVHLEERTELLERQKRDLQLAQSALEKTSEELERTNRYKSEFLANMSHELRTPLNSALILSKLLGDNAAGNLTSEQTGWANVIHSANNDLLALINDVLDLSKIEAGHVELDLQPVDIAPLLDGLRQSFTPVADEKGVTLVIDVRDDAPPRIVTDAQRLTQILRNLLSNAFKFTERGEVRLAVAAKGERIAFAVRDTGIGVAPEQQQVIFEAFRQADGTTSRKYGGTGLGLSISRTLAEYLGGHLTVESAAGAGSTFRVELPLTAVATSTAGTGAAHPAPKPPSKTGSRPAPNFVTPPHIDDDRDRPRDPQRLVLVVEDDAQFARILYNIAHESGFDCVHATTATDALALARELNPSGVLLDVGLPDLSGLALLEQMKRDPLLRHIPVHVVSVDDHRNAAMELGAVGYLVKPVDRATLADAIGKLERAVAQRMRRILVVEDDATLRDNIALLLRAEDIEIVGVGTVKEAFDALREPFDCMVMDLALPDGTGYDLLERIEATAPGTIPPVIVYTGRSLTRDEEQRLRRYSRSIIIKGARSPARLLDEVTLFLHRVEAELPPDQRQLLQQARQRDQALDGRRVLLAEDDARNIFALTHLLEPLGVRLAIARNGREALEHLERESDVDLVLMDVMMPEMDGLAAMRAIRTNPKLAELPIIALTAKAMPEDRRRCLEAGANDYIAKPIDVDKLLSLARVWVRK